MNAYDRWAKESERRRRARRDAWTAGVVLGGLLLALLLLFAGRVAPAAGLEAPKGEIVGTAAACRTPEQVLELLAEPEATRDALAMELMQEEKCVFLPTEISLRLGQCVLEVELRPGLVVEICRLHTMDGQGQAYWFRPKAGQGT